MRLRRLWHSLLTALRSGGKHDEPGEPRKEPSTALELRVHGVSGTPPTDLLDRPLVDQTTGDAIAGFYVPRLADESRDTGPDSQSSFYPDGPQLAGYSWGGLTSGSPARALWLLLLPLTLVNVAPRARPPLANGQSCRVRAIWYFARVLALALTCLYVVAGIGIGEDLIGWQCSRTRACTSAQPSWIFHGLSIEHRPSIEHMLLIGALVPTALLLIIWFTSSRTADRYERTVADLSGYRPATVTNSVPERNDVELPLSSTLMWHNAAPVRRLRAVHMQVGFALVLWSLISATEQHRVHWWSISGHWWDLVPLTVFVYALVALAMPTFAGHGRSTAWSIASRMVWALLAAAGGVRVWGLLFSSDWVNSDFVGPHTERKPLDGVPVLRQFNRVPNHALPYFNETVSAVCFAAIGALLLLILAVLCALPGSRQRFAIGEHQPLRPGLCGCATAAFAALGLFLAAALTAGTYTFAATWLHTGSLKPGFPEVARITDDAGKGGPFDVPRVVLEADTAYALAIMFLAVLLLIALVVLALRIWRPGQQALLAKDYPGSGGPAADGEAKKRGKSIRLAMLFGRLVDYAPLVIGFMVLTGLALLVRFSWEVVHKHGYVANDFSTKTGWRSIASLAAMGAYFAVLTLVGLVSLGAIAFRVPKTRRVVGILWDVASFWPRTCHPLAAPCYAERTVPDLITYLTAAAVADRERPIVLAAHSQGTVISAAAIRQLDTFDGPAAGAAEQVRIVPQLGFLSFGCVLRRLYGKFFPTYFGPRELHKLQQILTAEGKKVPRWRNLWRYTDYLGGQVTHGPKQDIPPDPALDLKRARDARVPPVRGPVEWEWHSPDPPYFEREPGDTTYSKPERHSNFWADKSGYFQLAVCELVSEIDPSSP